MDNIVLNEYKHRMRKCVEIAAARAFGALLVVGLAPRRVGDLQYLANHSPLLPGHPRRYTFKGRGLSILVIPLDSSPVLAVTTPFYESDIVIDDVRFNNDLILEVGKILTEKGLAKADVGIVGTDVLPLALYNDLVREVPACRFLPADDIVMNLRAQKSAYELSLLRHGAKIADLVSAEVREFLIPGRKEIEVANLIISELTSHGVTGAFATCQSGERSKEPYDHVPASNKVIENGDMVHMEINGKYKGYMIDICRSTVVGEMSENQRKILMITLEMLEESIQATKPGIKAEDLEKISGGIALKYGLAKNHTAAYGGPGTYLGHAIGLGVDEPPVLALGDQTILQPGMVLTIEPGIYRTPWGGCRIEDEVLVTDNGAEVLNLYTRKWWEAL